ncbi:uncharacterized protein LOC116125091 [Pistacia vera]|uniref:uncharacterized protein LOC116125091 n=1 Tax=Pistacia vera TaxID=55513 RepID=UPI001263CAAC|nr:uncharacterized protein LOC116125091 [Pistacia vera]
MGDPKNSATPSTTTITTAIPPYTRPLPDSWSRKKSQFSTIIDALNAIPNKKHRTDVQCKSRKDYIKKIHEAKKRPATSTSSNRRILKSSWPFPEYMDTLMANRASAHLLKLMLAVQQVVNDVPYPTSSFHRKEQATAVNEVTTPVSSTLTSPSRLGYGFSSLPLTVRARARIDSCSEEARLSSWSQEATFTLIEAWGCRCMELIRGNHHQKNWQHVADAVKALHAKSEKKHRTRF